MKAEKGFIPSHGNYTELLSYKKSLIIYSGTVLFCERFLNKRDRTVDQMVQAARSGIVCANIMVCLVNQCNYLLDRQIKRLEQDFVKFGGLRERMSQARRNNRKY